MPEKPLDFAFFKDLVPIRALSPDHCRELAEKSRLLPATSGQILFKEGEAADSIVYLIEGKIELFNQAGERTILTAGSKAAHLPLEQSDIHRFTARAQSPVRYLLVDPDLLDIMLTWDQLGGYEVQEIDGDKSASGDDWMARILQARVFYRIPPANIQSVFMKMSSVHFKAGETVLCQGDAGDIFYMIREGRCQVVRKTRRNPEGVVLAELGPGDHFGEDALISDSRRNASVIMLTDGVMMTLAKTDFLELLNEPLLQRIDYPDAQALDNAVWIDVRLPSEHQSRHVRRSINIPLQLLRDKAQKLDRDRRYIIYCDTGMRSSTAAYLLMQRGLDASVLIGGIKQISSDDLVG